MKRPDLTLVLPCYNEEKIFLGSVRRILRVLDSSRLQYEILFVDDGSTDITVHLITDICKKHTECRLIEHPINFGRGKTVADGFKEAKGDIVGYMDIDCEVSPLYIPEIVYLLKNNPVDGIIGKRMYRTSIASIVREVLSVGYRALASYLIGTKGMDTESGYKFFRRKAILPILPLCRDPHWFWDTEIIVHSLRKHLTIVEYPVLFLRRFDKTSSVHIVRDTITYLRNILAFRKQLG